MAKAVSPKTFWTTIKGVSIAEIAREANRPLAVALVGDADRRDHALRALYALDVTPASDGTIAPRSLPASPFVQGYDTTSLDDGFPTDKSVFDLVIDLGGGRVDPPPGTLIYSLPELGGWQATLERILDDRPDLALALARNFPVFRRPVAARIIAQTAATNAQFSLITGAVEQLPVLGQIGLPGAGLSDIIILTKNQTMMTMRLAAAYGLSIDYRSRVKELTPILANAVGWRAIARELIGFVPVVGFVSKAMIAYAGTVSVGKTVQLYYETGEQVTSAQARRLYKEAYELSREKVKALADRLRRKTPEPALSAAPTETERIAASDDPNTMDAEFSPLPVENREVHEEEQAVAAGER